MSRRDLARELDDTPDVPTSVWKPEAGDKLIGRVVVRDTVPGKFDDTPVERLQVDSDDGERVTVYVTKTVLKSEIAEKNPRVGDRIALQRLQDVPGKSYQRFRVLLDRATADDEDDNAFAMGPDSEVQ